MSKIHVIIIAVLFSSVAQQMAGGNQVASPVFNPPGGLLANGQSVTISTATAGASILYTLDGSIPGSPTGIAYNGPVPFSLVKTITVQAVAYKTGMTHSPITSATYSPAPAMAEGINLDGVVDWSTAWPFVDVFNRTRIWMTRNLDGSGAWDSGFGALVPVDTNGWPTRVPFAVNGTNQLVHTILVNINEPGTYNFIYQGTGSLFFGWYPGSSVNLTATGGVQTYSFIATTNNTQATIEIHSSATNDYLRNFHLVLTNFLTTYQTQPFHPLFLQRLQPFKCFRFMDWGNLNGSPLVSWTNRTTPAYFTQANPNGVALEYMVQLCNTLQRDAWICIPHQADDNYVRQAAQLLHDNMVPFLRIYIEYSNETWNGQFAQTSYVQTQGISLNLDPDPYTAGQKYVALRSAQIWNIFQQVFGSTASSRLVKVLATQSANTGVTDARVAGLLDSTVNPTGVMPDALAIAPYFGEAFTPADLPPNAPYPTVDGVLTNLAVQSIAGQQSQVSAQKAIADAHGWALICYEGGQSFQGIWGAENDTNLTAILTTANRDPRMFNRYTEYLTMLKAAGVTLYNNYSYCSFWSQWGSWAALEYQDQPTNQAPKYAALVQWMAANPVAANPVTLAAVPTNHAIRLIYGPVTGGYSYTLLSSANLAGGSWSPPGTLTGWQTNGNQISVSDNNINQLQKFYRVQISSP
jgi:Chitobiase/beta-hexosaminidase C-terminal domain